MASPEVKKKKKKVTPLTEMQSTIKWTIQTHKTVVHVCQNCEQKGIPKRMPIK
jgi:hypothetical protein